MQIDSKRLERQEKGAFKWLNSLQYGATVNMQGVLHYFTGVGKTFTAILIIKKLFRMFSKHNIVVIVPSEELQNQWNTELAKHIPKKDLNRISVFTAHWVVNNKIKIRTNTLIVDELHEYFGDEFVKVINGEYIQFDNNLGLTATYEDKKKRHIPLQMLYPIIDEITEEDALKEGYISPFLEFNIGVELDAKERILYEDYSRVIRENINKFGRGGLGLATRCLGGGKHSDGKKYPNTHYVYGWAGHKGWHKNLNLNDPREVKINDLWNPHKIFGYAVKLLNAVRKRKDLLYNCKAKEQMCLNLTFKFPELKTIIFSQSTSFADKMNLFLNEREDDISVVYHSKLETVMLPSPKTGKLIKFGATRLKRSAIEAIRSGTSRIICTASSLDKGFDVQDMGLAITASGTANFTQYKQRGGRVKRVDVFNPNKIAILVNIYTKNTNDVKWLKARQSKSTHKIYEVDNVDEINFSPKDKQEFSIDDI